MRRRTSGTTVTTWYLRVDSTRLSPVCRPSSMRSRLSKYRGSVRVYRVYSTAAVLKCLFNTLALILIQSMSVWMHRSTLRRHSFLSRTATSTSFQVIPYLCKNCRFFLTVPFQFVPRSHPNGLFRIFTVLDFSWLFFVTRLLLQPREEFNNEMQSLTSRHKQDIKEVKELIRKLQVFAVVCSVCF